MIQAMKTIRFVVLLVWLIQGSYVLGQNADDLFVRIYNTLQLADQLNGSGETEQAYFKYLEVQQGLKKLQANHPQWQQKVIKFRLSYVADKLAPLELKYKGKTPPKPASELDPLTVSKNQAASSAATLQLENRVRDLAEEVDRLRAEKRVLEAKLKEALAAQPASAEVTDLARAEDRIRALTKEIEVLRVGLDQEKVRSQSAISNQEATSRALQEANRRLVSHTESLSKLAAERDQALEKLKTASNTTTPSRSNRELRAENEKLKKELADKGRVNPNSTEMLNLRSELGQLEKQLKDRIKQNEILIAERKALQDRVDKLLQEATDRARGNVRSSVESELEKERKVTLAARAETESIRRENYNLESKLAELTQELKRVRGEQGGEDTRSRRDRIRKLELERDELKRQLADRALPTRGDKRENERLRTQVSALEAKLGVYEMKKDPFTPEELAFFKNPSPKIQSKEVAGRSKRTVKDLPPSASQLVAEAQSAFSARRFDEAERKYQEILQLDLDNVYTLSNLALVQMEQGQYKVAEENLNKAITIAPKDAYSLSLLGILKFRQSEIDSALEHLSRSVELDSKNAETYNYLGVVLSQKGLRNQAEATMRKAIQINPGYGEAHHNLAVIYISQNPPFVELARWHYDKALTAGHAQNPALEKYFEKKQSPPE